MLCALFIELNEHFGDFCCVKFVEHHIDCDDSKPMLTAEEYIDGMYIYIQSYRFNELFWCVVLCLTN